MGTNHPYLRGLLRGLDEILHVKHLDQCVAYNKLSVELFISTLAFLFLKCWAGTSPSAVQVTWSNFGVQKTEWPECLAEDGHSSRAFFPALIPVSPLSSFTHKLPVALLPETSVPPPEALLREDLQREQGREKFCSFPRAAATNYHNWVVKKQQEAKLLQ